MLKHLHTVMLDADAPRERLMGDAERLMQLVMQTDPIGTWRADLASGQVQWSERVFEIHGIAPGQAELNIDSAIRAYHPQDAKTVAWLMMNAVEKRCGFTFILRLTQPDGSLRLVQSVADVELGVNGDVKALFGIFRDVTERCTEKDVAEGRGRLMRSIVSNSPAPLVVLDHDMRYLEISPSWIDFYKLPPARTLIGRPHYEIMPHIPEKFRQQNARALKGEVVHSSLSYADVNNRVSSERGAVIFPWHASAGEIGGIIIMLTAFDQMTIADATVDELANLIGEDPPQRSATPLWIGGAASGASTRYGT